MTTRRARLMIRRAAAARFEMKARAVPTDRRPDLAPVRERLIERVRLVRKTGRS